MKKLLMASALLTSMFIIGCDTGSNSTGNVGATATAYGACPAGYWYSNGMCSNGTNTVNSTFSFNNGFFADNYSGQSSFQITNITKMKEFFKLGMGVCDRGDKNYQNIGSANCDYYISGYVDLVLQFPQQMNGNALITVIAKPRVNPYVNYYGQLPSGWGLVGIALGYVTGYTFPDPSYYQGAYRDPLQIQAGVSLINNSAGFVAQGYGDAWTGMNQTLVTIEVASGSMNSTSLNYVLKIGGVAAATGTMARCQYQNCGL